MSPPRVLSIFSKPILDSHISASPGSDLSIGSVGVGVPCDERDGGEPSALLLRTTTLLGGDFRELWGLVLP